MIIRIFTVSLGYILLTQQIILSDSQLIQTSISQQTLDLKVQEYQECFAQRAENNPLVLKIYNEITTEWLNYYRNQPTNFDITSLLNAINFAAIKHQGQYREGILVTPYIIHPLGVAKSLWIEGGIRDANTLIVALLHDTLEDTQTTGEELENLFGFQVRQIIEELTDDPALSSEEKRQKQVEHAPHLSPPAKLVKLADRLYNIRDLRNLTPVERFQNKNYLNWGLKLRDALRGINEPLERALESEIHAQLSENLFNRLN